MGGDVPNIFGMDKAIYPLVVTNIAMENHHF